MTKDKHKSKLGKKRKLPADTTEEVKKVKPTVSSLLVEQLVSSDSALSALNTLAEAQEDKLEQFFAGGGNASNLLHYLDSAVEKTKANDVALVFLAVEAVVSHVTRTGATDRALDVARQLVKKVLADYDKEIVLLISGTNTAHQAKAVLRMLTSFVMLGSSQAREVLLKLNWSHDNWDTLYKRTSFKEKPDVRTIFIQFLLSFLMDPDPLVIKDYLNCKTRLINLFSGMMHDDSTTLIMVLDTLKSKILENSNVNKTQKMKIFGSHTIKQILVLLKWTGGKKDEEEVDEGAKEAVLETVVSFIKTLLGSKRHGVIFQDPSVGQSENLNPLVREVIVSLGTARPWEDVSLSNILVEIVSACPDQLPTVLNLLEKSWEPRESASWLQVTDLMITIMSRLDVTVMAASAPPGLTEKILVSVLSPARLVLQVVRPGLSSTQAETVRCRCCHLLAVILTNLDTFISSLLQQNNHSFLTGAQAGLAKIFNVGIEIWQLWELLVQLLDNKQTETVQNIVLISKFWVKMFGVSSMEGINIGAVMQTVQREDLGDEGMKVQLLILDLMNVMILTSEGKYNPSLKEIYSEDTFRLLLKIITSSQGEQKKSALETFSGLVITSGIVLQTEMDLDLLLSLVDEKNSDLVRRIIVESIEKKTNLLKEIEELKFQEIWNVGENAGKLSVDDLFEALTDTETNSEYLKRFSKPETELFSPLSLTISKISSTFSQDFLQKYIFLFSDCVRFCQVLQLVSMDRTNNFHGYVQSVVDGLSKTKREDGNVHSKSVSVIISKISEILHHSEPEYSEELKRLLQQTPCSELSEVLQSAVDKIASLKSYSPFKPSNFSRNVAEILKFSDTKLMLDAVSDEFAKDLLKCLKKEKPGVEQDHLALSFQLLPLSDNKLEEILEVLTDINVQKIASSSTLKTVITGICYNLSLNSYSLNEELFAKLFCIIEVIVTAETEQMVSHLINYFKSSPTACSLVSSNLVTVLLRTPSDAHMKLVEALIIGDKKHYEAVKSWVCQQKLNLSHKVWPLVKIILEDREIHVEKKFTTIVVRHVVQQVEAGGSSPELLQMLELLGRGKKTEKQLSLWGRAGDAKGEVLEHSVVLRTLQESKGGLDTRIMRESFLPLLNMISDQVKTELGKVLQLCQAAVLCREKIENKVFLKEFQKQSESLWPKFYRSVLKYCLKVPEDEEETARSARSASVNLLADISEFLMNGGKLTDAGLLAEMVSQHSCYLSIMTGPGSDLKTALLSLLLALAPDSCTVDQVPVLLSSYTGSLHPSDRALLTLLQRYETVAGLDLGPFQPFIFGVAAVQHYSSAGQTAWKQAKFSEVLAQFDPEQMRRTSEKFPLMLCLDPEVEVAAEDITDLSAYDPRFVLPVLCQLLSSDVYIDKHLKLLEVGGLHLSLSSLSSKDKAMRCAGYTVLARLTKALEAAKLSQEKQVWSHVISLLRHGIVSSNLSRAGRLSCIITQFLARCTDILQNPLSPLYRTVSRSILAKPLLDLSSVPEFQRLMAGDKTEFRWCLETIKAGLRDSKDYSLCVRTNMAKVLQCQVGGLLLDRAGHLLVLDILLASVATNYGCVDLVARHGLLTWCIGLVEKEKVDKVYVKEVIAIARQVVETSARIDQRKADAEVEEDAEGGGSKRLMMSTVHAELTLLLSRLTVFAEKREDAEIANSVSNLSSLYQKCRK